MYGNKRYSTIEKMNNERGGEVHLVGNLPFPSGILFGHSDIFCFVLDVEFSTHSWGFLNIKRQEELVEEAEERRGICATLRPTVFSAFLPTMVF